MTCVANHYVSAMTDGKWINGRGRPNIGRHPNFKTGKFKASNGYILIFVGVDHHLADVRGYAYEHRIIAESKIGRRLRKGEQVHHKDENKLNNDPGNLIVVRSFSDHRHAHGKRNSKAPDEPNPIIPCACGCGQQLSKYDKVNRPRKFIRGHNAKPFNHGK